MMRQRKAKNMEERMAALSCYQIEDPASCRGKWNQVFENNNPIYLELGCGKGQFLTGQALAAGDRNFVGIEGQDSVLLRALEKTDEKKIVNIRFAHLFVKDIRDLFADGELAGIYLNFSDPWPKKRHAKRRLTHRAYLEGYKQVLAPGGCIEIKTDNDDLFDFTLEEIEESCFAIKEMTRDLHASEYAAKQITTEYEDKFRETGKNINYVRIG